MIGSIIIRKPEAQKISPPGGGLWGCRSQGVLHPEQRRADLARRPLFDQRTDPPAPKLDTGRGGGAVIRHYLRLVDSTVWAILVRDGSPLRAIGPIPVAELEASPVIKLFAEGLDARGWDLSQFTPAGKRKWICAGARPQS